MERAAQNPKAQLHLQGPVPAPSTFLEPNQNRSAGIFPEQPAGTTVQRIRTPSAGPLAPPPSRGRSGPGMHPPAAIALDDQNQSAHRTAPPATHAGYRVSDRATRPISLERPAGKGDRSANSTGFSPLAAGFADFNMCSPPGNNPAVLGASFNGGPVWGQSTRRFSVGGPSGEANAPTKVDGFPRVIRPAALPALPATGK